MNELKPCGLLRRLAAIVYDGMLLVALWMVGAALWLWATGGVEPADGLHRVAFQAYVLAIAFGFFTVFWVRGGRTLGMQAWRLTLQDDAGNFPTLRQAAIRFAVAIVSWLALGLGFLWSLGEPRKRTWHDMASGSRLLVQPKRR